MWHHSAHMRPCPLAPVTILRLANLASCHCRQSAPFHDGWLLSVVLRKWAGELLSPPVDADKSFLHAHILRLFNNVRSVAPLTFVSGQRCFLGFEWRP
ncbi:hypothetical protein BH10CYA1_BH10CYA1_42280 [soil metagenome]